LDDLLWIFAPIDHALRAWPAVSFWVTGAVNFDTAFSGFSRDTPWFLFGASSSVRGGADGRRGGSPIL